MPSTNNRADPDFYRGNARPSGSFAESVAVPLAGIVRLAKHNFGNIRGTVLTSNGSVPDGNLCIIDEGTPSERHYFANDTGAAVAIAGDNQTGRLADARAKLSELFPE